MGLFGEGNVKIGIEWRLDLIGLGWCFGYPKRHSETSENTMDDNTSNLNMNCSNSKLVELIRAVEKHEKLGTKWKIEND